MKYWAQGRRPGQGLVVYLCIKEVMDVICRHQHHRDIRVNQEQRVFPVKPDPGFCENQSDEKGGQRRRDHANVGQIDGPDSVGLPLR